MRDEEHPLPSFALVLVPDEDLLGTVLRKIQNPDLIEGLQFELASLANKVVVADQIPPDSAEALRGAIEKALAYVNLGLELRSGGSAEKAADIIEETFLEYLFRHAQAEVARIRGQLQAAVKHGWLGQCPSGIKCLDREWFDAAGEILARTPKLLQQAASQDAPPAIPQFDFFRTPQDLARGDQIVDVIIGAGQLYESLNADPVGLEATLWREGQVRGIEDITLGIMVLTAAARFLISGDWSVAPLPVEDWPAIFPKVQPAEMDRAVMDRVHKTLSDPKQRAAAQAYLAPILRDYDLEMQPFSAQNPPEPEMVKFFMFTVHCSLQQ